MAAGGNPNLFGESGWGTLWTGTRACEPLPLKAGDGLKLDGLGSRGRPDDSFFFFTGFFFGSFPRQKSLSPQIPISFSPSQ